MVSNNQVKIQVAEINDFKNIIKALEDKKNRISYLQTKAREIPLRRTSIQPTNLMQMPFEANQTVWRKHQQTIL